MNEKSLVSIVIPIYNTELYLEKTILSAIKQTYKNIEVILVDDGSTDNSARICEKFGNNNSVRYIRIKNGGG